MEKHFLGKSIPRSHQSPSFAKRKRVFSLRGGILMSIPFLAFGAFLVLQPQYNNSPETASRAVGPAVARTFAVSGSGNVAGSVGAAVGIGAPTANCTDAIKSLTDGSGTPQSTKIFPIIPQELKTDTCNAAVWDRSVIVYFIAKAVVILNWLASTLAILFTLYVGLLYITSYANQENIKKAKALLIATYAGLVIVILARVIIFGAVDLLSSTSSKDAFNCSGVPIYVGSDTTGTSSTDCPK